MWKRKTAAFLLALLVFIVSVPGLTAHASEYSDWIELLETTTVDDSGDNLVTFAATSGTFTVNTPQYMRCTKVDLILTHPSGATPTSVKVRYNSTYYTLTLQKIDNYTTRAYGANLPDALYSQLTFQINKSGTASVSYQVLSCRVTSLANSQMSASAYAEIDGTKYTIPFALSVAGDDSSVDYFGHYQFPIWVTDWQKYDKIIISGSVGTMALNSVRVTIGGLGLPYEMSYAVSNSTAEYTDSYTWYDIQYYTYDESYMGSSETSTFAYTQYYGKTLFTITIDLTGVDRTSTNNLCCYFTTLANPSWGYSVQIMDVMGTVEIADTAQVSWWTKLTTFFTDLLSGDNSAADEFQDSADQQSGEVDDLNEQIQEITKPPASDIDADLSDYVSDSDLDAVSNSMSGITSDSLFVTLLMMGLSVALLSYILYGKR